jgi:hypothetical protein
MMAGARVRHDTFGLGTIGREETYQDLPSIWVDIDDGRTKGLALQFAFCACR